MAVKNVIDSIFNVDQTKCFILFINSKVAGEYKTTSIKQYVKILFCSLYEQFNWQILSPNPSTVFTNRLFSSPSRTARITSKNRNTSGMAKKEH